MPEVQQETSNLPANYVPPPDGNGNSKIFGVSVRAWITIWFDFIVLGVWAANQIFTSIGWTQAGTKIDEPLYTIFVAVNTYYFSSLKQNK